MMAGRKKILVTRKLTDRVEARLAALFDATLNPEDRRHTRAEVIAAAAGHDAILLCTSEPLDAGAIAALPESVKVVATLSVGTDHVDVAAAKARGIAVLNTPGVLTDATADIGLLLLLGAMRRAREWYELAASGNWLGFNPTLLLGVQMTGRPLGILGMGRIGRAVAQRARAFGAEIHYHNRSRLPADQEAGATYHADADALLRASQLLVLSAPATDETRRFLNARRLALLPRGAIVVNIARGDLVDDDALIAALESGHLAGAGLDVYNGEPFRIDRRYWTMPNVFMTPHVGSATIEARDGMGMILVDGFVDLFAGRTPANRVV